MDLFAQQEAEALAESWGAHLVTISSPEENDFVASLFPFGGSWFWIGLNVTERGCEWVTGEPFIYSSFPVLQEKEPGPRVLSGKNWCYDLLPSPRNCFIIEWD